jgi:uncharacterized protein YkwD
MKPIVLLICCIAFMRTGFSQNWSQEQLNAANTAKAANYLTQVEKDVVLYLNLARLYPQQFVTIELKNLLSNRNLTRYQRSLIADLNKRSSAPALQADAQLFEYANCFAKESGEKGIVGHKRVNCSKIPGAYAECCSYGMETGKSIVLQWLVDQDVPSLGHRINCLNAEYQKIGIKVHPHKVWTKCAVADFTP